MLHLVRCNIYKNTFWPIVACRLRSEQLKGNRKFTSILTLRPAETSASLQCTTLIEI